MYYPDQDEYPNNCTVYIEVEWDNGSVSTGSGAIVGTNDILTAAHVVYDPALTAVDIDIFPAYDGAEGPWGSFTSGTWHADYYTVGNADGTISQSDSAWDLALIGISDPIGDSTGWYGMQANAPGGTYEVMGYPGEQGGRLTAETGPMEFASGTFDISDVYHAPGSSGGPILNAEHEVVGVVSSTAYACRIDDEWDALMQWMSANDALLPMTVDSSSDELIALDHEEGVPPPLAGDPGDATAAAALARLTETSPDYWLL